MRAVETQEKIFLATVYALAESGISGVTHRSIAEKAGVSLASTTYHFKTKADLLAKTYEWMVDQFERSYRARLNDQRVVSLDREGLVNYLLEIYESERALDNRGAVAWYEFVVDASRRPELQHVLRKWYFQTIEFYAALFNQVGVSDPNGSANRYVDFVVGWSFFEICMPQDEMSFQRYELMIRRIVDGMLAG